ncbi:MAG: MFS transporter [Gammaproteobacteria bacterium]|nr:MFS transporter [Gammaproteobacteria bacterium]
MDNESDFLYFKRMRHIIKSITIASLGNLLEWYDFGLFASFSLLFSQLFFPQQSGHLALIEIFAVYAVGFFCRPLGAILFGMMGDRYGRVKTLRASIFAMTLPTILIAFLPTYAMLGIGAPLMLMGLRLFQGMSLGGEFTGVIIYLAESAPRQHRAFLTSFAGTIANVGFLFSGCVAAILVHLMTPEHFAQYGWRLAFLLGGALGLMIFYLQRFLKETHAFSALQGKHEVAQVSFWVVIKATWPKMLLTIGLVMLGSVLYYMSFVYFFSLLQSLGMSKSVAYILQAVFLGLMLIFVPLGGVLCDHWGRRKTFLILAGAVFTFSLPALYLLLSGHFIYIVLGLLFFVLLSSLEQGTTSITVVEQFPAAFRYSGLSFSYNLAQAIFGGTAPMLAGYLSFIKQSALGPAFYLMGLAAVTFLTALFFLKKNRPTLA